MTLHQEVLPEALDYARDYFIPMICGRRISNIERSTHCTLCSTTLLASARLGLSDGDAVTLSHASHDSERSEQSVVGITW